MSLLFMLMLHARGREIGSKLRSHTLVPISLSSLLCFASFYLACIYIHYLSVFVDRGGLMDIDQEDVMILLPQFFAPKDVPDNLV